LLQRPPAGSACSKRLGALNGSPQSGVCGRALSLMDCSALLPFLKFPCSRRQTLLFFGSTAPAVVPPSRWKFSYFNTMASSGTIERIPAWIRRQQTFQQEYPGFLKRHELGSTTNISATDNDFESSTVASGTGALHRYQALRAWLLSARPFGTKAIRPSRASH
jgi:hypothetical protein